MSGTYTDHPLRWLSTTIPENHESLCELMARLSCVPLCEPELAAHDWCQIAAHRLPVERLLLEHARAVARGADPALAGVSELSDTQLEKAMARYKESSDRPPLSNRLRLWLAIAEHDGAHPALARLIRGKAGRNHRGPLRSLRPAMRTDMPGLLRGAVSFVMRSLAQPVSSLPGAKPATTTSVLAHLASPCSALTNKRVADAFKQLFEVGGDPAREAVRRAVVLAHLGGLDSLAGRVVRPVSPGRTHWLRKWDSVTHASWRPWVDTPRRTAICLRVCMGFIALVDLRLGSEFTTAISWREAHLRECRAVVDATQSTADTSFRLKPCARLPVRFFDWVTVQGKKRTPQVLSDRDASVVAEALRYRHVLGKLAPQLYSTLGLLVPAVLHDEVRRDAAVLAYVFNTLRVPWSPARRLLYKYYTRGATSVDVPPRVLGLLLAVAGASRAFDEISWYPTSDAQYREVTRVQRVVFGGYMPPSVDVLADCLVCKGVRTPLTPHPGPAARARRATGPAGFKDVSVDSRGKLYCNRVDGRTADICNRTPLRLTHVTGRIVCRNGEAYAVCSKCIEVHRLTVAPYCTPDGLVCDPCRSAICHAEQARHATAEAAQQRADTRATRRRMTRGRKRRHMTTAAADRDAERALARRRRHEEKARHE